jgi:thiamine biosynthesis lipoprotein
MKKLILSLLLPLLFFPAKGQHHIKEYSKDTVVMGSYFVATAVSSSEDSAYAAIDSAISEAFRIQHLISSWDPKSHTSQINDAAGQNAIIVDRELYNLVHRSKKISELTEGSFDISAASLMDIWSFDSNAKPPTSVDALVAAQKVNYENIILFEKESAVYLKDSGMKIGFGGIGKGYVADKASEIMKEMGIKSGIVNAGGDLYCWGTRPSGELWSIAVADPDKKGKTKIWLNVKDQAVVTSGNYEKYIMIMGEKYCHILDPKTGYAVKGIKSVTIFSSSAELSDAIATAIFVMGVEKGIKLIDQLKGIDGFIIDSYGKMHSTTKVELR